MARNIRGRNNSNLNQISAGMKGQMHPMAEFNLTNAFNLSTLSPAQARGIESQMNEQYVKKHAHGSSGNAKMGVSGSQLKIPTITLHNQSFYNHKMSPRHFTKDRQGQSNNRSPELSNAASGYLRASNSNSPNQFNKTIYQMPSINVIQSGGPKKGKELRQKINSQIQKSQLKLQVISERNEANRAAMKETSRAKQGQSNFPNVVSPKSGDLSAAASQGSSPERNQRGAQQNISIPQIRKNPQYNLNFSLKKQANGGPDSQQNLALATNTNGFNFGSRRQSNA